MASTPLGIAYPIGSDEFAPHIDMKGIADSLEGRIIVPVANTTARAALVAAVTPSVTEPLYVERQDAPAGQQVEYTTDGTNWITLAGQMNGTPITFSSGWASAAGTENSVRLRLNGRQVFVYGSAQRQASGTGAGSNILTLPPAFAPPSVGTRILGPTLTSAGNASNLYIANGTLGLVYGITTVAVGVVVPIVGSWWLD